MREAQVNAAIRLLDEGSTVPFIARYRKEVTGELDDSQMRLLEERLHYLRELEGRRGTILASIEEQDKLTPALKKSLLEADTKNRLEDLYLPYKPKRRTKAQIAREAGLEPLANFEGELLVLNGDVPLLREQTIANLLERHRSSGAAVTLLTARLSDPTGYGRLITSDDHKLEKIVEHNDASDSERALRLVNGGVMAVRCPLLFDLLEKVGSNNAKGET